MQDKAQSEGNGRIYEGCNAVLDCPGSSLTGKERVKAWRDYTRGWSNCCRL